MSKKEEELALLIRNAIENDPKDFIPVRDLFDLIKGMGRGSLFAREQNTYLIKLTADRLRQDILTPTQMSQYFELQGECLLFASHYDVDSYFQRLEWNRDLDKRFYLPRRPQLRPLIQAFQDIIDDELDVITVSLPPGSGKLLSDDTPILTTKGWKNHGDLKVGDYVYSPTGKQVKVTHVHPKGVADVLVEFTNGEKIQCHENHEWFVYDRGRKTERTVETKEFFKNKLDTGTPNKRGHRYRYQIPLQKPIIGKKKTLPVHPYVLGAWLGDGTTTRPHITSGQQDKELLEHVVYFGYAKSSDWVHKDTQCITRSYVGLRKDLNELGLCYSRKTIEKFIPDSYLTASAWQRLQLLAGLIDTDGHVNHSERKVFFTTSSIRLRDSVMALINTFGWRPYYIVNQPRLSTSGIQGRKEYYVIGFSPTFEIPCLIERKQLKEFSPQRRYAIKSVKRVEPKKGNCITVEGGLYLAGKTLTTTHNSTAGTFFMTMLMGIQADKYHVMSGYADSLTKMFYDNALAMITDPEYAWKEIFPHLGIVRQSGTDTYIDIGKRGAFPTLTTKPIGGSLTGRVRCSGVLYSDDLVSGIEEAMNPDRLDKLWQRYSNDLRSRTVNGFKEVMVATRWSVNDPIGRLQILHEGNPRAKFINMPALDENGESNFDYKYNLGFSTKHYLDMRDIMDDVSWNSLYMQEPYEREGLLYKDDELRRFYELPKQEPDAIISICDTKEKGSDYAFAPVAYVYGDDYYIADCIVDNSNPEFVEARIAQLYTSRKVQASRFESNSAGGRFADSVKEKIDKLGGITHITKKFTTQNKETKIVVNSPWVKEHCLFLDKSKIEPRSDYSRMMRMLTTYTMAGRNKNDDVVDGFAMLSQFAQSFMHKSIKVMNNPLKYL